jgi:hypothetical protein
MGDQHHSGEHVPFDMRWLADRLDRIEAGVDERFDRMAQEIQKSRHGLREVVDTIAIQVAELVTSQREHERRITQGEASHSRKGDRLAALERWQARLGGAVAVLAFLFPTTVGVILKLG